MSNCISNVATSAFPIDNVTVKGVVVYIVASSKVASIQLTNNCMIPVSNIAGTLNPWV